MKKILILTFGFVMMAGMAFADMMIAPNALPPKITQFINANFAGAQIMYAEQDFDSFEVKLNTGVELDFYTNGDWKEVKTYQNFPTQILPAGVVQAVKGAHAHPQAFIIKAEKTWNGYEIKTSNMMEIYVTPNGQIMGQKFDD